MQTALPARPDVLAPASPAPKTHRLRWIVLGGVGMFVALGIIGAALGLGDQTTTTTPDPITVTEPLEPGLSVGEAMGQAAPLLDKARRELGYITATSDISADVGHLNTAADLTDAAAALFVGVDEGIYLNLSSAADHVRAAADAEELGDFVGFNRELNAAADDMRAVVEGTSLNA
jgi:hypothetical protein